MIIGRALFLFTLILLSTSCYNFNNPVELDTQNNDPGGGENPGFDGTFESYGVGTAGTDAGFVVTPSEPSSFTVEVRRLNANNFLLVDDDPASDQVVAFHNFDAVTSGSFQVSFSLKVPGRGAGPGIEISDGAGTAAVRLFVGSDGYLVYATDSGSVQTSQTIPEDTFTSIQVSGDVATKQYSVTVDGSQAVSNQPFLQPATSISRFSLATDDVGTGSSNIDNISFASNP